MRISPLTTNFAKLLKISLVVAIPLVLLVGFALPPLVGSKQLVSERDFGAWSYSASQQPDGTIRGIVHCDYRSIKGLSDYVAANKVLADQLASTEGQVSVDVTFRSPVGLNEFRVWAVNSRISFFEEVNLREVNARRERVSTGINPMSDNPLPQQFIEMDQALSKQSQSPTTIRGVVNVRGKINAKQLPTLAADPNVFVADVTANVVRNDLRAAGMTDKDLDRATIYNPVMLFWAVEDLGLETRP